MSQENQSQPTLPIERKEPNFIGQFYKQPDIGSGQTDNSTTNEKIFCYVLATLN